jgi:RHS repeat-associated protein
MAAQTRTVLLCLAAFCLPALANVPRASLRSEKPHQGVAGFVLASHRGAAAANALIAPGLRGCLYDSGRRSRSTGKERDAETGLDYFLARYMSSPQGRFTSPDPFNVVLDSEDRDEFNSYLANPQSWNRYSYVWNNPLKYVDPLGETVYLVTYTTGNQHGDEEFRRAAETRASEIQKQKGFDSKKDAVLVRGVKTKEDFAGALNEANSLGEKYGQVGEVSLFAHAGRQDGPVFHDSGGRATQFSNAELGKLSANWESGACARFYGCNTGVKFAQKFANAQGVTAMGYEGFAYFSSEAQRRSGPQLTGPLYLIHAPGYENSGPWGVLLNSLGRATASPMVRRTPRR